MALHLETANTFQQIRKVIMRQMHDEFIGVLEAEDAQPLYTIEPNTTMKEDEEQEDPNKIEENWQRLER